MSLTGGYDLSKLKKTEPESKSGETVVVPSLILDATESSLREVLGLSAQVPVVVEFHADSVKALDISPRLRSVCVARNGAFVLVRIDAQQEQRVAQAFAVKGAPTVLAVIKGQPVPLFEGDQDQSAIEQVVDRVLEVAKENGVKATAVVGEKPAEEPLPALHQQAFDAISAGDFELAIQSYEQALRENPRDDLAISGLAQVRLLQRTIADHPVMNLAEAPTDLDELLLWADFQLSEGNVSAAFGALLDAFEAADDRREPIRKHLLDLFAVVEPAHPDLLAARRRLASLLY
ncbi:MAG: co-chaperone YbbN [Microbacteriaceae bacterium]